MTIGFIVLKLDFAFFHTISVIAGTHALTQAILIRHHRRFFTVWIPVNPFAMRFAVAIAANHLFLTVEVPQGQRTVIQSRHKNLNLTGRYFIRIRIFFHRWIVKILHLRLACLNLVLADISNRRHGRRQFTVLIEINGMLLGKGGNGHTEQGSSQQA